MRYICEETTNFVRACEAIHALLADGGMLTSDERDLSSCVIRRPVRVLPPPIG